jgi:hypothetical protein
MEVAFLPEQSEFRLAEILAILIADADTLAKVLFTHSFNIAATKIFRGERRCCAAPSLST